jgi:hypothetical protein
LCLIWSREQGLKVPREKDRRECVAVLCGGKIATILLGARIVEYMEDSCEEEWQTEEKREQCCYVGFPTHFLACIFCVFLSVVEVSGITTSLNVV